MDIRELPERVFRKFADATTSTSDTVVVGRTRLGMGLRLEKLTTLQPGDLVVLSLHRNHQWMVGSPLLTIEAGIRYPSDMVGGAALYAENIWVTHDGFGTVALFDTSHLPVVSTVTDILQYTTELAHPEGFERQPRWYNWMTKKEVPSPFYPKAIQRP